eukprot:7099669-Pyramimonas_sp.AAC.1
MPTTSGGQLPLAATLAVPTGERPLSRSTPSTSQPGAARATPASEVQPAHESTVPGLRAAAPHL